MSTASPVISTALAHTTIAGTAQETSPPIVDILRFTYSSASAIFALTARACVSIGYATVSPLSALVAILYQPLLYLLAPGIVFCNVVFDAFVRTPYSIAVAVLTNIYPLYVFVGASCICAGCIGLGARIVVNMIKYALFPPKHPVEPAAAVPKPRKRVSIKEEKL